jgi:hypothetical protein
MSYRGVGGGLGRAKLWLTQSQALADCGLVVCNLRRCVGATPPYRAGAGGGGPHMAIMGLGMLMLGRQGHLTKNRTVFVCLFVKFNRVPFP